MLSFLRQRCPGGYKVCDRFARVFMVSKVLPKAGPWPDQNGRETWITGCRYVPTGIWRRKSISFEGGHTIA